MVCSEISLYSPIVNIILIRETDWIRLHPELILMQDGASSHTAADTIREFAEKGVRLIYWPPYSPDLNPIEAVWNIMKDWIQENYGERMTYPRLRIAVRQAWDAVGKERLDHLIDEMHDRCQAVIDAKGMHTKY